MNRIPLLILIFSLGLSVSGQTCDELKALIDKSYDFKPSKLTSAEIDTKSSDLDKVWDLVGKNTNTLLPCLRSEIIQRKKDSFFRFNASNLLFKHDPSLETKKLMIDTYAEADLADINLRYWLSYMSQFGREGLDVTKAGEAWIRFPKPIYYLPQHGGRPVDKGVGALAIFGGMDETLAAPALARLAAEENTDFRSIALVILVNLATPESDQAIVELSKKLPQSLSEKLKQDVTQPKLVEPREGKPKTTREEFTKAMTDLLNGKPEAWITLTNEISDGEKDMVVVMGTADLPLIRKFRRYYAANASPHSLEWYLDFTKVIRTIQARSQSKASN